MKNKNSDSRKGLVFVIILLAVICIGGAELGACKLFSPELYDKITAPVRAGVERMADVASGAAVKISDGMSKISSSVEIEFLDDSEKQIAGEPTLYSDVMPSGQTLTELKQIGGHEILTGGTAEIVYYNQADDTWASKPYGTDHIGGYGCGPVSMAMVVSSLTKNQIDPAQMAEFSSAQGYWCERSGSYLSIVEGISYAYGLKASAIGERTPDAIRQALTTGRLLVALMGPGHFTSGGHFIVIRGVTLTGNLLVADPNSRARSLMEWDPDLIISELSASTSRGAPLWVISA